MNWIEKSFTPKKMGFFTGAALALGYAVYYYASRIESRRYQFEKLRINTAGGGKKLLKVLHLSDLHLSAPETHKIDFLQSITDADYDLVFLTGDIFEDLSGIQYASKLLARQPRLGAYAVLGNHEYYAYTMLQRTIGRLSKRHRHPKSMRDVTPVIDGLERVGIRVLRDEAVSLSREEIHIVGIDYPNIAEEKLTELVNDVPDNYLKLGLMHVPENMSYMSRAGFHVVFMGHTHGGQVRIPGLGALTSNSELPRSQASGLIWRDQTAFHISRGLGADPRTNFRLFCPPAATLIEINNQST